MLPLRYIVPVILILAFQYFFVKDALNYASPIVFQTMVYLIMAAALSVACGFRYIFSRKMVLFCLAFWLSGICWMVGLSYVSAPESAILAFTMPLFSIPLAIFLLRERSAPEELVGAVVGFSGVVLYNLPLLMGGPTILGIALSLGNGFFWALFSVYGRKLAAQDPIQTIATAAVLGVAADIVLSVFDFTLKPSVNLAVDVGYQGILGTTVSLILWMRLLKLEKTSKVTTLTFVAPVITLAFGVAITRVIPNYLSIVGVVLIFAGIYVANILGRGKAEELPLEATTAVSA